MVRVCTRKSEGREPWGLYEKGRWFRQISWCGRKRKRTGRGGCCRQPEEGNIALEEGEDEDGDDSGFALDT